MIIKTSTLIASVLFVSIFSASAQAAPVQKKATTAKAAATPAPTPAETDSNTAISDDENAQMDSGADEGDSVDAVDQPLRRAVIESAPAPGSEAAPILSAPATTSPPAVAAPSIPAKNEAFSADTPKATATPASATPPAAAASSAPSTTAPTTKLSNPVTAEQSLKWLTNGNARFTEKNFRADGRSAQDRASAAKQQKPHAVILSCSESVAPPEIIFDQGIGEITAVRVAGPALDSAVIRSLELAVEKYDSHLLIVLGHTQCSSVEESPYVKNGGKDPSRNLEVEAALNADGIARALTERSQILKTRVDAGQLTIKSGLYWIDTGKVKFY